MRIFTKYLLKKYIINFIIILFSLEVFFVGIDFLQNYDELPSSANLQLLYILYNSFFTLTLTLPLSLIFGWILTLIIFVKSNELIAFFSLGISKKSVYRPILFLSTLIILLLISIQATPLAYSYDQKSKILDGKYFTSTKNDIFLKYDNYFVYFKKLHPLEKYAEDIHIFKVKNENDIIETIVAKKAYFQNNKWYVVDAKITKKPEILEWSSSKIDISYEKFLYTLEGFKPKILDNVYEVKSTYSILDAISAISLLLNQDINTDKIRAALYYELVSNFIVLPFIVLIFVFSSYSNRFFNIGKFSSFSIGATLVVWGIFFMLQKFSKGGILNPELAILLPIFLWYTISYFIIKKKLD